MKDLSLKMKIAVVIGGIIVIGTIGLYMYNTSADSEDYAYYEEDMNITDGEDTEENVVPAKIMVHVTGQVKDPRSSTFRRRIKNSRCNRSSRRRNR